jgi:NAD(P)-dependent dehydrogenase (short-subunit alcohol dehydrogenase family)
MSKYKNTLFDLSGEIAVVTGGMGQLGAQFSLVLMDAGAKVAIVDITDKTLNHRLREAIDSEEIMLIKADITDKNEVKDAAEKIKRELGITTVLVNNAALDSPPNASAEENGPFESYPEESWNKVLDVNLKGVFLMSQVFGGEMAKNGKGSIINISSVYGMVSPNQKIYEYRHRGDKKFYKPVAYSVSKSGVYNFTRYLAAYWAKKNVRVNTLTLGGVFNNQDSQFLENYCGIIPKGRMAKEDEYNGAILFLASMASGYMTGSNLVIDGGWTII